MSVHNTLNVRKKLTIDGSAHVDDIDAKTATTLLIGKTMAAKVEIADSGVITEVQGTLDVLEDINTTGVMSSTRSNRGMKDVDISTSYNIMSGDENNINFKATVANNTVILPDATTLPNGWEINIVSDSTSTTFIDLQDSSFTRLGTVGIFNVKDYILVDNGTAAGIWEENEPHVTHNISVEKIGGDFNKITDAIASVTPSTTDRYVIDVGPGEFTETPIIMKEYVTIVGSGIHTTVIFAATATQIIITGSRNSSIRHTSIQNASGVAGIGILMDDPGLVVDDPTFLVQNVDIKNCETCIRVCATSAPYPNQCKITVISAQFRKPFVTGVFVDGTSTGVSIGIVSVSSFDCGNTCDSAIRSSGMFGVCLVSTVTGVGVGVGNGVLVTTGSNTDISSAKFSGFVTAINVENSGSGSTIQASSIVTSSNVTDVLVDQTTATGTVSGVFERSKVIINSPSVIFSGLDPVVSGLTVIGPFFSGYKIGDVTDVTDLISSETMGLMNGGLLSEGTGDLEIDVSGGIGYLMKNDYDISSVNHVISKQTWLDQSITVPSNLSSYIYINSLGVLASSASRPHITQDITLGRVKTSGDGTGYEITPVTTVADVAGNLGGKHFTLNSEGINHYVWFNVDSNSADPEVSGTGIEVNISEDDTAGDVAIALNAKIDTETAFGSSVVTNTVTITNVVSGNVTDATVGDSGFTLGAITQGEGVIEFIEQSRIDGHHSGNDVNRYIREVMSNQYVSGSVVTEDQINEVTQYTTVADVSSSLEETYFILQDAAGTVAFWFDVSGAATIPGAATAADRAVEITTISADDTANTVAALVATAVHADSEFTAVNTGSPSAIVDVTCVDFGNFTDATAGDTGFSVATTVQGASLRLAITGGLYYYNGSRYTPTGFTTPATFYQYNNVNFISTFTEETVVNNTQYDDGENLTAIAPSGMWVKHALYIVGDGVNEKYLMVIGQIVFSSLVLAQDGILPTPPTSFTDGVTLIASLIMREGESSIQEIRNEKPTLQGSTAATAAVTDHGALTGLTDDDHAQYLLANGTRAMAGALDMGMFNITNVGTIDGINIEAHASRHGANGGVDALSTAAPLVNIGSGTSNAVGTADTFARSDHQHGLDSSVVTTTDAQVMTNKTLTAPVLNAVSTLNLDDTNSSFNLALVSTSTMTISDKTLTINVNNADRALSMNGDLTTSGAYPLTLTQTASTNVTLPTTGTLSTLAGAEALTNKTITSSTNLVRASELGTTGASVVISGSGPPTIGQVLKATSATVGSWGTDPTLYDAIVDASGAGDYTTVNAAFTAGHSAVFVRDGLYTESASVDIPNGGALVGESMNNVVLAMSGAVSVSIDGSGGTKEITGTVSITNGTSAVAGVGTSFTNLNPLGTDTFISFGQNYYEVVSVTNDTNLVISSTFNGSTLAAVPYTAQHMISSAIINNVTITSSTDTGLYARATRHSSFTNVVCRSNNHGVELVDTGNTNMINVMSIDNAGSGIRVEDSVSCSIASCQSFNSGVNGLHVLGNSTNTAVNGSQMSNNTLSGLCVDGTSTNTSIENCMFDNNEYKGMEAGLTTGSTVVKGCIATKNTNDGIDFDGSNNVVDTCIVHSNGSQGIRAGDDGTISNNHVFNNVDHGIHLNGDSRCQVVGNNVQTNDRGIVLNGGTDHCSIIGNTVTGGSGIGIYIDGGDYNAISGNVIFGLTGLDAISLISNSINNVISNNVIRTCGNAINITAGSVDTVLNGNTIESNTGYGIQVAANTCIVTNNRVTSNGGDGCIITGTAVDVTVHGNNFQGNTGTDFNDSGVITSLEGLLSNELDSRSATTLALGAATATKVEIADSGIITEVKGELETISYIQMTDMTAPSNPIDGKGRVYKKTGNDGLFWLPDSAGTEVDLTTASTQVSSTSTINRDDTAYAVMTGMTITPGVGTYLVTFSGDFVDDEGKEPPNLQFAIHNNGVIVAHTERTDTGSTQCVTTVADAQAIDVRWKTSGSISVANRSLVVTSVN